MEDNTNKISLLDLSSQKKSSCGNFYSYRNDEGKFFLALRGERFAKEMSIGYIGNIKKTFSVDAIRDEEHNMHFVEVFFEKGWYSLERKTLSLEISDTLKYQPKIKNPLGDTASNAVNDFISDLSGGLHRRF